MDKGACVEQAELGGGHLALGRGRDFGGSVGGARHRRCRAVDRRSGGAPAGPPSDGWQVYGVRIDG